MVFIHLCLVVVYLQFVVVVLEGVDVVTIIIFLRLLLLHVLLVDLLAALLRQLWLLILHAFRFVGLDFVLEIMLRDVFFIDYLMTGLTL